MGEVSPPAYPNAGRAWAFIAILFVASIVSVIDRSILNIVVDPVRASLSLSDVEISLLQGLAFGILYAVAGIPLGLIADRYSRRWLIIGGMTLWSCATIAGGLAQSFGALFFARILVGLGEASLGPAAISLIGDLFPPGKRGRPISIYLMGQAVASGLSVTVAGSILQAGKAGHLKTLPLIGGLEPWRQVFVFCGLAGVFVLLLLLPLREPLRRRSTEGGSLLRQASRCLTFMMRNGAVFIPFYLGFALCFTAAYGAGAWFVPMLQRGFHAGPSILASRLGPISIVFGLAGPFVGGWIVDRNAKRGLKLSKLTTLIIAPLIGIPSALAVFAPGLDPAIILVSFSGGLTALIGVTTFAALQTMVPDDMRGIAVALTGLINTLFGASLGPLIVATLTERVFKTPAMVGYSIAALAMPALILAALCFAVTRAACRRQLNAGGDVERLMAAG